MLLETVSSVRTLVLTKAARQQIKATRRQITCAVSLASLVVGTFFSPISHAAATDGKAIFNGTCIACHGSKGEGNSKIGAPNIAGMEASYIQRQLAHFSSGLRGSAPNDSYGAQMRASVAVLKTDADRAAIASYIASLPQVKPSASYSGNLSKGSTQFNAVCSSCHGSRGQGNPGMGAPSLIGVEPQYLERQINAFRSGQRGANPDDKQGGLMKVGASMLPDAGSVRDVVAYIATLKP